MWPKVLVCAVFSCVAAGCAPLDATSSADPSPDAPGDHPSEVPSSSAPCAGPLALQRTVDPGLGAIFGLAASGDGRIALATEAGAFVGTLAAEDWEQVGPAAAAAAVTFGPDQLAVGDIEGHLARYGAGGDRTIALGADASTSVSVQSGGERIAWSSAAFAGELQVWEPAADRLHGPHHTGLWEVYGVAWMPDGERFVAAGHYYGLPRLEVLTVGAHLDFEDPPPGWMNTGVTAGSLRDLVVLDDGVVLTVGHSWWEGPGTMALVGPEHLSEEFWEATPGRWTHLLDDHGPVAVAAAEDQRTFLTAGLEGDLALWAVDDGAPIDRLALGGPLIDVLVVGSEAVVAGDDGVLRFVSCEGP